MHTTTQVKATEYPNSDSPQPGSLAFEGRSYTPCQSKGSTTNSKLGPSRILTQTAHALDRWVLPCGVAALHLDNKRTHRTKRKTLYQLRGPPPDQTSKNVTRAKYVDSCWELGTKGGALNAQKPMNAVTLFGPGSQNITATIQSTESRSLLEERMKRQTSHIV